MGREISYQISCEGGLDQTSNTLQLLQTPGAATVLKNFESAVYGGYRRVSGYNRYPRKTAECSNGQYTTQTTCEANSGTWLQAGTQPSGANGTVRGVFPYADGLVAIQGGVVYFSTDGITWTQVNKSTGSGGQNATDLAANTTILTRSSTAKNKFINYEGNQLYGELFITNNADEVARFYITGTGSGRLYFYEELTHTGVLDLEVFAERLIFGGHSTGNSNVVWSDRYIPQTFTGSTSGSVDIGDDIVGIKAFRNRLFIFCKNSIHTLQDIDGTPNVQAISKNVGCIAEESIQEVGGDIIFLAPDGLRTIAGTMKIDDIEMSTVSHKINPTVRDMIQNIANYDLSSLVIRSKNQYRLYYPNSLQAVTAGEGIIGVLKVVEGMPRWEWSKTKGIAPSCIASYYDEGNLEKIYHGGYDGYVYEHDTGNTFDGTNVNAEFKTPDIGYGDVGIVKNLHWLKVSVKPEGDTAIEVRVKYDYESGDIHHPTNYTLGAVSTPSKFGTATFNTTSTYIFGAPDIPAKKLNIEGSGFTNSFAFVTEDANASYNIQSFHVDFIPTGKR